MPRIAINTRVLRSPVTGVQRYTAELLTRWEGHADCISPKNSLHGLVGHSWEQLVLPGKLKRRLLFSPSNSGPLVVENQIVTIHDMAVFDCPKAFAPQFEAFYRFLLPRLARRVRQIIAVSEFVKKRILFHVNVAPAKVVVIPNGVSPRFSPSAIAGMDVATATLGLPSREYVLVVGSLEPRKNLVRLLQAWAQVQGNVSTDIWLVVAGAGTSRVFRETHWGSLPPRVLMLGHVDDILLPALYAGALAMAYVSIYEGFGLPPLEAMASGTPVLVGNGSSLPEIVGDAGVLVNPFDVESIARGLQRVLEDSTLRSELRRLGVSRARQFSWNETAQRTWDVLRAAAN